MNTLVDIILIVLIILGAIAGMRKGLIKSLVSFVGLIAIVVISYTLRVPLSDFLIDKMPFLSFGGSLLGITSINILIFNVIAFVVIFIVMYSILNIILNITGFIDTILKFTVIWVIPSKIGGAILGFLEMWVYLFLVLFVLGQFSITANFISDSKVSNMILDKTPVVGNFLSGARNAAKEIYSGIEEFSKDETKSSSDLNLFVLQTEINYGLITKEKANELLETGKIGIDNIMIGHKGNLWSNI